MGNRVRHGRHYTSVAAAVSPAILLFTASPVRQWTDSSRGELGPQQLNFSTSLVSFTFPASTQIRLCIQFSVLFRCLLSPSVPSPMLPTRLQANRNTAPGDLIPP